MREDHEEALHKMFPEGYCIIYTCPDGQRRMNWFNPKEDQDLHEAKETIKENFCED